MKQDYIIIKELIKMAEITDRELLAICNLSNLKLEFAELTYQEGNKKDLSYHTIYSLLVAELNAIEKRAREGFVSEDNEKVSYPSDSSKSDYYKKLKKAKDEDYGPIYRDKDNGMRKYQYFDVETIIDSAPIIMEYYYRYADSDEEGKKSDKHEGHFLEEWDVIYAGDNYSIGLSEVVFIHYCLLDCAIDRKTILSKLKENKLIKSRDEVESSERYINVINAVVKFIKYPAVTAIINHILPIKLPVPTIMDYAIRTLGWHVTTQKLIKTALEISGDVIKENLANLKDVTFIRKVSLTGKQLKVVIVRKKDKSDKKIIFAINNNSLLSSVDEDLNSGHIPQEVMSLLSLCNEIILDNPNYEIIFTGCGVAGKIATILGMIYSTKSQSYYVYKPSNISSIIDFTEKDVENINSNLNYLNLWELEKERENMELTIESVLITGALLSLASGGALTIPFVVLTLTKIIFFAILGSYIFKYASKGPLNPVKLFMKKLYDSGIISNLNEEDNKKHYKSNIILGLVSDKCFEKIYTISDGQKNLKIGFISYITILYLTTIYKFSIDIFEDLGDYTLIRTNRANIYLDSKTNEILKILAIEETYNNRIYNSTAYKLSALMDMFHNIQQSYISYTKKFKKFGYFFYKPAYDVDDENKTAKSKDAESPITIATLDNIVIEQTVNVQDIDIKYFPFINISGKVELLPRNNFIYTSARTSAVAKKKKKLKK
jgi:hypothetical protein